MSGYSTLYSGKVEAKRRDTHTAPYGHYITVNHTAHVGKLVLTLLMNMRKIIELPAVDRWLKAHIIHPFPDSCQCSSTAVALAWGKCCWCLQRKAVFKFYRPSVAQVILLRTTLVGTCCLEIGKSWKLETSAHANSRTSEQGWIVWVDFKRTIEANESNFSNMVTGLITPVKIVQHDASI